MYDLDLGAWKDPGRPRRQENYKEGLIWKSKTNLVLGKCVFFLYGRKGVFVS